MVTLKTLLTFCLVGVLLGGVVGSWLGREYMAWNNEAALATQTVCDLPAVVRQVAGDLIRTQLISAGVGGLVFLVLGILVVRARSRRPAPPAATPPAPRATGQQA